MSASTFDDGELGVDRLDGGDIESSVSDEAQSPDIVTPSLNSITKKLALYTAVTARLRELKTPMQAEERVDSKRGIPKAEQPTIRPGEHGPVGRGEAGEGG